MIEKIFFGIVNALMRSKNGEKSESTRGESGVSPFYMTSKFSYALIGPRFLTNQESRESGSTGQEPLRHW